MSRESFLLILSFALALQAKPIDENLSLQSLTDHPTDNNGFLQVRPIQNIQEMEAIGVNVNALSEREKEEVFLSVPKLIEKNGYISEIHQVQTSDGYILEMHRIVGKTDSSFKGKKQPVFLMHGLLGSSANWVMGGLEFGLGYLLSDMGYDIWMGNARGNTYSRKHISFDPDGQRNDRKHFWDFSWHQIGIIDLPTMIDYVLQKTEYEKLHYIGHSQGTTSFFVMASERPDYNDKIIAMYALAPVAFMSNVRSPIVRVGASFLEPLDTVAHLIGMYEFLPSTQLTQIVADACNASQANQMICTNIVFLITGFDSDKLNETSLPSVIARIPAGGSTRQFVHYGQEVKSEHFRQYDWGTLQNLIQYGRMQPPDYELKNIRAPVGLYYSTNDELAEPIDVEKLYLSLPNPIDFYQIQDPTFTHLDFIFAKNAKELVYNRIFEVMKKMEGR